MQLWSIRWPVKFILLIVFIATIMSVFLKAASVKYYGAGLLSAALISNGNKRRIACDSIKLASTMASTNPLMDKHSLPRFADIQSVHVLPAIEADLQQLKSDFAGLTF